MTKPALSEPQLDAFEQDGYSILSDVVPAMLLQKLRMLFDEKINSADTTDKAVNIVNGQSYVCNVEYLFKSDNLACLELLGSPFILETAETICGPDFFFDTGICRHKNAGR